MKRITRIALVLASLTVFRSCATVPVTYTDKNGNSITYGPDGLNIKGTFSGGGVTVGK